ncbi:MAG: hypothetical protein IT355_00925 [Gemmatimonadaceae bacterium]|nr:hypothetical protein [Gemmatimonadaceae bacterium]
MSAIAILICLFLIVLAALLADHYGRLTKMGWAPEVEEWKRGRSQLDPLGSALGELGRADGPYKLIAALLIGIEKGLAMVFNPIGAALGLAAGPKGT